MEAKKLLESILLVTAICIDAFVASLTYGTNKINIPLKSCLTIAGIGSITLLFSMLVGSGLSHLLSPTLCTYLSFAILIFIGVSSLFQNALKSYLRRTDHTGKRIQFQLLDISFIIKVYLDETKADVDNSKHLSTKEAVYLAVALSLDSLATGFSVGLVQVNILLITLFSFVLGILVIYTGCFVGKLLSKKTSLDFSSLSGLLLIILAFSKII